VNPAQAFDSASQPASQQKMADRAYKRLHAGVRRDTTALTDTAGTIASAQRRGALSEYAAARDVSSTVRAWEREHTDDVPALMQAFAE
jgi:hypothetical protein